MEEKILEDAVTTFDKFLTTVAECDKKLIKEAMAPFFIDGYDEELMEKTFGAEPQVRMDDVKPENWEERFQFMKEQDYMEALKEYRVRDAESGFVDPDEVRKILVLKHHS